jgi:beta-glucanase (GH16 family)
MILDMADLMFQEGKGKTMKALYGALLCVLCLTVTASGQTWTLVWSDEFTGPGVSLSNWTYDYGAGGWGNSELEYYTSRPVNAATVNGALVIVAKKESYAGSSYTSARLKTQNLRSFMYGKVEARIKLPIGQGLWPAFWMLGSNITQVGWPSCGEIDIMEHISNVPLVYGTMHWNNNGHVQYGGNTACDVTQYHVYSIEWNASTITWFLDGVKYWEGNIANNINSTDEFHAPFFIILNLAVGGAWPGFPDATTPFPDTMFVDYVRVYQNSSGLKEVPDEAPKEFGLDQNYPNPFNPETEIRYRVQSTGHVTLKVYDMLGREVAVLVNEQKAPGSYSLRFDASGLASGVYLYQLEAGNPSTGSGPGAESKGFKQVKSLVLLR